MPKPRRNIDAIASDTLSPPDSLTPTQTIARLKQAAGNNLYQLELPSGETILAELQQKFRSTIWLKRGSYVLLDTASLADRENKIAGEVINVVGDEKAWRKAKFWPKEFAQRRVAYGHDDSEDEGPGMPPQSDDEE